MILTFLSYTLLIIHEISSYEVPETQIDVLHPKGLVVSVLAEEGMTYYEFRGQLNNEITSDKFDGFNNATWLKNVTNIHNGRFKFVDENTELKLGDILYYWARVFYRGTVYIQDKKKFHVMRYFNTTSNPSDPYCDYNFPAPKTKINVFYPKGLEVSIPAGEGISYYEFRGKLNEEIADLKIDNFNDAYWSKKISEIDKEKFKFVDEEAQLNIGDILYYWTRVVYRGTIYVQCIERFLVTNYVNQQESPLQSTPKAAETICKSPALTEVNGRAANCAGDIIYEDNFDSNEISSSKWRYERRFGGQPDYEFVVYLQNTDVMKTQDGFLHIKPILLDNVYGPNSVHSSLSLGTQCTGDVESDECSRQSNSFDILPPLISGQISSKGSFNFKYGTIEVRAKLPSADWIFPQLFLNPVEHVFGTKDYKSGQMRIAFIRGGKNSDLYGGIILGASEPLRSAKLCHYVSYEAIEWNNDFHVYKLTWKPDAIIVSVDNHEYCKIQPGTGFYNLQVAGSKLPNSNLLEEEGIMAPFNKEFYITLGYGVGGHNDFADTPDLYQISKPWSNWDPRAILKFWKNYEQNSIWLNSSESVFQIDYVKVFAV